MPGCVAHRHRTNVPSEQHFLWPRNYHGSNVKNNKVTLCIPTHKKVHELMERLFRGDIVNFQEYDPAVRKFALRGYFAVMNYGGQMCRHTLRGDAVI